ncbi:MAG: thiol reductase thioredoxin [Alphaproteobacteria bacterium]|nr:thiol reductase thioredoxin [Alphaproteobacteria bacterium]
MPTTKQHIVCTACGAINATASDRDATAAKCGACAVQLFAGKPADVDAAAFDRQTKRSDVPVLVDVWAPWCGPCRTMTPMFEAAARVLEPHVRLLKLNADDAPEISQRYGIRGIPALLLLHRGRLIAQSAGVMDTQRIVAWTRAALSSTRETAHDNR